MNAGYEDITQQDVYTLGNTASHTASLANTAQYTMEYSPEPTMYGDDQATVEPNDFFIDTVEGDSEHSVSSVTEKCISIVETNWNVDVLIANEKITLKIDTGAQCNVLSTRTLHTLGQPHSLQPNRMFVRAFGGSRYKSEGEVKLRVIHNNAPFDLLFQVIYRPVSDRSQG